MVTALAGVAPSVMPIIRAMHAEHPGVSIEWIAEARLARLEYGEAHIAFRAGPKPDVPDYVVRHFRHIRFGLYASQDYIDRVGPTDGKDLKRHRFVGTVGGTSRLPYASWVNKHVPKTTLALRTSQPL